MLAEDIYQHAQSLLRVAHECSDQAAAAQIRRIANALLEMAHAEAELVAVPRAVGVQQ